MLSVPAEEDNLKFAILIMPANSITISFICSQEEEMLMTCSMMLLMSTSSVEVSKGQGHKG